MKVDGTARPSMTASLLEIHEAKGGDETEAIAIMDAAALAYAGKSITPSTPRVIVTSYLLCVGGTDTVCLVVITTDISTDTHAF